MRVMKNSQVLTERLFGSSDMKSEYELTEIFSMFSYQDHKEDKGRHNADGRHRLF